MALSAGVEGTILALAVALSAFVAADGDPLPGDLPVTRRAQDLPLFHSIARVMRWGMSTEAVLVIGSVASVALCFARRWWEAGALVIALTVLRVTQPLIKNVVDRERPSEELVERRAGFSSESFPSGHMMSGLVLCGMLAVALWGLPAAAWVKRVGTVALAAVVVLNGTSSVYMGVHWPSDVLAGVLWGGAIVLAGESAVVWGRSRG